MNVQEDRNRWEKISIAILVVVMFLGLTTDVFAGGPKDACTGKHVTHECLDIALDDLAGQDGADGVDGADGIDGTNGIDGVDGTNGIDGINGTNGVDGINGTNGVDGLNGVDGVDGTDGINGIDGIDGINGTDGRDGKDGKDGIVPTDWYDQLSRVNNYLAASNAIQIHLPDDATSRITFGIARVNGANGLGVGYAYRCHDCERDLALTFGFGTSDGETVGKASIGWEF